MGGRWKCGFRAVMGDHGRLEKAPPGLELPGFLPSRSIIFALESESQLSKLPRERGSGPCHTRRSFLENVSRKRARLGEAAINPQNICSGQARQALILLFSRRFWNFLEASIPGLAIWQVIERHQVCPTFPGTGFSDSIPCHEDTFLAKLVRPALRRSNQLPRKLSLLYMLRGLPSSGSSCLDWPFSLASFDSPSPYYASRVAANQDPVA